MQQMALFDYNQLGTEDRIVVQQRTGEIKELVRTTAENVVRIGEKLVEVRSRLDNGRFTAWIKAEFDWSRRTAYNFISVFEQFGSRANFAQLDIATSALYLLASPSTPPEARAEALERAESGERVTHSAAKALVEERKSPLPLRPTPDADPDPGPPPPRPPQTPPPPPRLRPDQEPRPAGRTLEQTVALDTRYSIFECPACGEKKIKRDRGSYACHGCQASWDGGKAFFDHVNERDADGQPADDGLPDWVVKPEGLEPDAPARSELCPACGDEAFFPDGGWKCDGCERRCSKLEAMYNHAFDFYCRACHLATHEQGPPLPDADLVAAHDALQQVFDVSASVQEGDQTLHRFIEAMNKINAIAAVALGLEAA